MMQNKPKEIKPTEHICPSRLNRVLDSMSPISATPDNVFSKQFRAACHESIPKNVVLKLVCTQAADKHWDTVLTDFRGEDLKLILGIAPTQSETILLDQFIPQAHRTQHRRFIDSILNEKLESAYWSAFMQKLTRDIIIVQPHTQIPHLVNISIRLDLNLESVLIFEITLTDKTIENKVANKAGLMTHNIRPACRNIINRVSENSVSVILSSEEEVFISSSPDELRRLYDVAITHNQASCTKKDVDCDFILQFPKEMFISSSPEKLRQIYNYAKNQYEKSQDICIMAHEILQMCADSREDFLVSALRKQISIAQPTIIEERVLVSTRLRAFIEVRRIGIPKIPIHYSEKSSTYLESNKIDLMEQLLLNLITNAIQAMNKAGVIAPEITVNCFDMVEDQGTLFQCEVIDNGPGMSRLLCDSFFKRPLPMRQTISSQVNEKRNTVESNRGEGTMMAFQEWESVQGTAVVLSRKDGKSGARFQVSCRAYPSQFFSYDHVIQEPITQKSIAGLDIDKLNMAPLKGIILLVDDQYSIIKLVMRTLSVNISTGKSDSSKPIAFNQAQTSPWENKVTTDVIGAWGIICASNGQLAYEIIQRYPTVKLMITDFEMPEKDGINLIKLVRQLEENEPQRIRIRIVLNTGRYKDEIEKASNEKDKLDFVALSVDYILKGIEGQKLNTLIRDELESHLCIDTGLHYS